MGKKEAKENKQLTDFSKTKCCPSVVIQRAARRRNGLYERSTWGNWDPHESQQPIRPNPSEVGDCTTMLRWMLIGAEDNDFVLKINSKSIYLLSQRSLLLHTTLPTKASHVRRPTVFKFKICQLCDTTLHTCSNLPSIYSSVTIICVLYIAF